MHSAARIKPLLLLTLFTVGAFAQRDLGTIVGTVTDPQGSAIAGAKITITEAATGQAYDVKSGDTGDYIRPALKPGTYSVTAEAKGFRRFTQQNITLVGGDRVGIPITLKVGDVSETIEVSADAPLLQTESTELGANLNKDSVSELPLGGQRTFAFLARLSPGVLTAESGARDTVGGGFSANGVRSNGQNNFLLNGVDNNVNVIDFLNQTSFVVGPSVEAIGEMRVMTNGYNAEYGRGAGGVVSVSIKSGTNELHGVLFEVLQNADLNANRWENNKNGQIRGPFRQNQFGAAVGGPIRKNRTFIFGDYQGTRIASSGGVIGSLGVGGSYTIPTALMRSGNFSELGKPMYDPASQQTVNGALVRTPFTGNIIPSNRMDPVAVKMLALYPATNQPLNFANGFPQNDYYVSTPGQQQTDQGDLRIDHRLSDKDSIFGTMSWSNTNKVSGQPFPGALDGAGFNQVPEVDLNRNAMASWTRVWGPAIITETRLGFTRLVTSRVQNNSDQDLFKTFGIAGYDPTGPLNGGLPQFDINNYSQIGANNWLPSKEYSNVWDFIQNVAINKQGHAFKFGAEFRQIRFPFFQVPEPHGELWFKQDETAAPVSAGSNNNGGDAMASFLLGQINGGQISTDNFISSQKWGYSFYGQDDWKISPKLTLSLGLRYELSSPINEGFGRQSNFNPDTLTLDIPKGPNQDAPLPPNFAAAFPNVKVSRGQVSSYLIPWDKTNFGPRIGIAYNALDKTVVRLGYGIFYGGEENQGGNPNRGESVPFNETVVMNLPTNFQPNPYFLGGLKGGFPVNVFTQEAPINFRDLAQDFRNTLVHKWNAAVQRELPHQMALEIAYVGSHTSHGLLQPDQNACPNSPIPNVTCDSLRPLYKIAPNVGGLNGTASFGIGNYHGGTLKLEKRMSNGLTFLSAYTYGHALANSGTTLSGSSGLGTIDPTNYTSSYTNASWDIRHNWVTSFTYALPIGKGQKMASSISRAADLLIGGWQMNGILTVHSGQPFTINGANCIGQWWKCRADLVSGKNPNAAPSGGRSASDWFDWSAVQVAAAGTGGNLGLQSNYAPPTRSLDFSLFKDFKLTERIRTQFRAESFNLTNTVQLGNPDNNLNDAQIVGGKVVGQGNLGRITSSQTGSERHVQFSLRLMF